MTYLLGGEQNPFIGGFLHMSTKPWGDYSESDYTLEQWHRACLIHQHSGQPTSKSQCKLPIRTPSGAVNKNAIFAATAALAGARTPINADAVQKERAARTLLRHYREMNQKPPESLLKLAGAEHGGVVLPTNENPDISELAHYGVKGMRWGVRRSPEELGRARGAKAKSSSGKVGYLSEEERAAAAQLAFIGSVLTVQGARNFVESGNSRVLRNKGKRFVQGQFREGVQYKKNSDLAKNMSEDDIMSKVVRDVNPDFGSFGANQNCRRCTMAYEMRRRGMDVKATKTTNARGQHGTGLRKATGAKTRRLEFGENKAYEGQFGDDNSAAAKATFKALSKQPNGSRGEVGIGWMFGGGHSVAYEIVNNKPVIFDAQSAKKIKTPNDWMSSFPIQSAQVSFTRLDNKPLNEAWLERWVKNND